MARTLVRSVGIKMFSDTAEAQRKMDAIDAEARRLGELNPEIKVQVETRAASLKLAVLREELKAAGTQSDETRFSIGRLGKSLDNALPRFAGLASAGIALGPALLPVLAAGAAGAIGLGAAVTGAGAALGIFGIAAKYHFSQMEEALKKVQAANLAANQAGASPAVIAHAKQLTAQFQKDYGVLAVAADKLKSAWTGFTSQPVINTVLARGMNLLTKSIPHLTPLLNLGAQAAGKFIGALSGWVDGGGLDRLVKGLTAIGGPALAGFGKILHNLAVGFGALAGPAGSFASGVVNGLVRLSAAFASWAQNKGPGALSGLMDTIRKLGPGVLSLIRNLAAAVPNLAAGLFPLAPLSLALATSLAKLIRNTPPGVITAIAVAFVAWTAAAKGLLAAGALGDGWKAVAKFARVTEGATVAETIAAAATRAWGLAMDALPWVALAAAVVTVAVLIIRYHKQIWAFVQRVWDDILGVIRGVWNWIRDHWPLLLEIITGPFGLAIVWVVRHWHGITDGAKTVISWFRGAWSGLTHILAAPFRAAFGIIKGIWDKILSIIHKITGWLGSQGTPGVGPHGVPKGSSPAAAQAYAKSIMGGYGMSAGTQFPALQQLWNNESGWRWNATNRQSGAYGIPQSLPASKMASAGADWRTNYQTQVRWGLGYIRDAYRQPTTALAMWEGRSPHWYDAGGYLPRGMSLAVNNTGAPERVMSPAESRDQVLVLRQIRDALYKLPGVQAAQLGRVLSGRPVAPRPSVFAAR